MYYSYVEIEYVATSLSPVRTDLAVKLLMAAEEDGWWQRISGDIVYLQRMGAAIVELFFELCLQFVSKIECVPKLCMNHTPYHIPSESQTKNPSAYSLCLICR